MCSRKLAGHFVERQTAYATDTHTQTNVEKVRMSSDFECRQIESSSESSLASVVVSSVARSRVILRQLFEPSDFRDSLIS